MSKRNCSDQIILIDNVYDEICCKFVAFKFKIIHLLVMVIIIIDKTVKLSLFADKSKNQRVLKALLSCIFLRM